MCEAVGLPSVLGVESGEVRSLGEGVGLVWVQGIYEAEGVEGLLQLGADEIRSQACTVESGWALEVSGQEHYA